MPQPPQCFISHLLRAMRRLAPPELAEPWDNPGLQIGNPGAPLRRAIVSLELTAPILAEAAELKADAIVTHHPLIFKPWKSINLAQPGPALAAGALRAGIAVLSAHTNLDAARWSTAHALAERLGWLIDGTLAPREEPPEDGAPQYKFVVFTPRGHEQAVIDAIARGGGGRIGAYTRCSFRSPGTGTFQGNAEARPFIGEPGQPEEAEEFRIEAVVPAAARAAVYRETRAAHPYEEMACDWIPLAPPAAQAGLGGLVKLPAPLRPDEMAALLKEKLDVPVARLSGPPQKNIKTLAICTGGAGSFLGLAAARADAMVTGEITYHHAIEAAQRGLAVVELGHFESETLVCKPFAERLAADRDLAAAGVEVVAAKRDVQPFRYL